MCGWVFELVIDLLFNGDGLLALALVVELWGMRPARFHLWLNIKVWVEGIRLIKKVLKNLERGENCIFTH